MVKNRVDFEKFDRPSTKWFGSIDCHHIYYKGYLQIEKNNDSNRFE